MKLQFKIQPYQTAAVDSVVDCFAGQPSSKTVRHRIDEAFMQMIFPTV